MLCNEGLARCGKGLPVGLRSMCNAKSWGRCLMREEEVELGLEQPSSLSSRIYMQDSDCDNYQQYELRLSLFFELKVKFATNIFFPINQLFE